MLRLRISLALVALVLTASLGAQESKTPPAPGFDTQACVKHCQDMAAAHQKMMESHKAMMDKHQAAWKDIQAQLDVARKARGEKKVAALEAVIEKLIAFHESMQPGMGSPHMMKDGMGMDCCGGGGTMDCCKGGMMDCCKGGMMGGMKDCCAGAGMAMGKGMDMDCPMMHKMPTGSQAPPKASN